MTIGGGFFGIRADKDNCWETGSVCQDKSKYPECRVSDKPEDWMKWGMHLVSGFVPSEDKKELIFKPGWRKQGVQGICMAPNPETKQYDFAYYSGHMSAHQAMALYNESNWNTQEGLIDRDGIRLTAEEMLAILECKELDLGMSDFACRIGQCPSHDTNPPAGNPWKATGRYVFRVNSKKMLEGMVSVLKDEKIEIKNLGGDTRKRLVAHLEGLIPMTPQAQNEAAQEFQKTEGEKGRQLQEGLSKDQMALMKESTENQLAAMKEMGDKQINTMVSIAVATVVASLGGMAAFIWVVTRMNRKQLEMMRQSLDVQKKSVSAIMAMDQKPKITDLAEDLVDTVRREFSEDLVERMRENVRTVENMRKKMQADKSYRPTAEEEEAEAFVRDFSGKNGRDAEAVKLLMTLSESPNPSALVSRMGVGREVAEKAAFMIASGDSRVPEKMREGGIWLETKPDFDIVGRREEALQLLQTWSRGQYQNAYLSAETGAGKFEVFRAAALLIARDDPQVPPEMRGKRIWFVNNTAMIAGTKYRGTFADKQQVLEEAMLRDGDAIYVEELAKQINAGKTTEGDAEAYSNWLLRVLTKKKSRFGADGKADDYDYIVGQGIKAGGTRDFRRRLKRIDAGHLPPEKIREALDTQVKKPFEVEKNCEIPTETVEAATRLGIAYREHLTSPPFDAAKSVLMDAVMEARAEAPSPTAKVTVTVDHVISALHKSTGMEIDSNAARDTMFAAESRPHTQHPFLREYSYNDPAAQNGQPGRTAEPMTHEVMLEASIEQIEADPVLKQIFPSTIRAAREKVAFVLEQARILWQFVDAQTQAQESHASGFRGVMDNEVPITFVQRVRVEAETIAQAQKTVVSTPSEIRAELSAKHTWFRRQSTQVQGRIVSAIYEAAHYNHVRASGAIVDGQMTPQAIRRILEITGIRERVDTPLRVLTAREVERDKEDKETEREREKYERFLKERLEAVGRVKP